MRTRSAFILLALAIGCSVLVENRILQPVKDCVGVDAGTPCDGGDYCYADQCRYSFCGDGVLNADRGEECDDGNLVARDGCEPATCTFTCDGDTACPDDGNVCNGPESCIASLHRCESGPEPAPGLACTAQAGAAGTCSQTYCVPAGCGDGVVNPSTEECEPPAMGCMVNCLWECEADTDCPMSDPCTNARHCDVPTHSCVDDGPLTCDDGDACTSDTCSSGLGGCSFTPRDADRDGYAPDPYTCSPGGPVVTGDCDDDDPSQYPGAPETLNGEDDDCDGEVDEGAGTVNCYEDLDGDGFGNGDVVVVSNGDCPDGYVQARPRGFDCADLVRQANPGLGPLQYFAEPYCLGSKAPTQVGEGVWTCSDGSTPSFDYDCSRTAERQSTATLVSCAGHCGESGWMGTVPECGVTGSWLSCGGTSSSTICPTSVPTDLVQRCR